MVVIPVTPAAWYQNTNRHACFIADAPVLLDSFARVLLLCAFLEVNFRLVAQG